jgi:hypothetical protein
LQKIHDTLSHFSLDVSEWFFSTKKTFSCLCNMRYLSTRTFVWRSQVEGSDFSFIKFIGSVIRPTDDYCSVSTSTVRWTTFFFLLGHGGVV